MARQARELDLYGRYHITQTSQPDRVIFRSDDDRQVMLDILRRAEMQYNFELIAYCLIDADEYHLVLKLEGCDIRQLMKSVNIGYTKKLDLPAGLFRDRYESTLLTSPREGQALMRELQERSEGHLRWNSFCTLDRGMQKLGSRNVKLESQITPESLTQGSRWPECLKNVDQVRQHLKRLAATHRVTLDELMARPQERNILIRETRRHSTLSQTEIGAVFNLSPSSISKILHQVLPEEFNPADNE